MYCTANDVALLLGYTEFNNNTSPTLNDVLNMIKLISHEIDYYLDLYKILLTDKGLFYVKKKAAAGVAGSIMLTYLNNNQNLNGLGAELLKEYRDFIYSMPKLFRSTKATSNYFDDDCSYWGI